MIWSVLRPATSRLEAVLRSWRTRRRPLVSAPSARTICSVPLTSITSTSSPTCRSYLCRKCAGIVTWPLLFSTTTLSRPGIPYYVYHVILVVQSRHRPAVRLPVLRRNPLFGVAGLGGGQDGERFLGGVGSCNEVPVGLLEQPGADHPVQLGYERLPELLDVEQDDGLAVQPEL